VSLTDYSLALIMPQCLIVVIYLSFYRVGHMHSADYAVARCVFVCLSVCHTLVLCLNGYMYPQTLFTIGYPHHSSFPTPNWMGIF